MSYEFAGRMDGIKPSAIREILKFSAFPGIIPFAAGNPAPDAFPVEEVEAISSQLLKENPILALQYSVTEGYTPLRDALKKRMETQGCFNPDADELIVTAGAQQANELACKILCNEGDTLICEAPTFIGSLNAFKSYKTHLVGIELENDGMNIEKLEEALQNNKNTKLMYIIPNFQNPTGFTTSLEKRKAIYELACKYDIIILEDNPSGDLRYEGEDIPSIKSLDTENRVIYSGSFSKILAPGLRVGYASAPKELIQKMIICKQVADVHTNIWAQAICERFLAVTDMNAHFERLRSIYRKKCNLMFEGIEKHFSKKISVQKPQGGLFTWATLPDGCDMNAFCTRAVKEFKVAVVPGNAFTINDTDKTTSFRMNFSTPTDEQLIKGCELLGKLSKEMFD